MYYHTKKRGEIMKTKKSTGIKAILCFVLAITLCLPSFIACSESETESSATDVSSEAVTESKGEESSEDAITSEEAAESSETEESSEAVTESSEAVTESSETEESDVSEESSKPEEQEKPKKYSDGLFAAEFVEEDDLNKYGDCIRFESDEEYNVFPTLITPKSTIYNVQIFSIIEDFDGTITLDELLFETDKVTTKKPLLADIIIGEVLALNCISFTDKDNNRYYYTIMDSGRDGSIVVSKADIKEGPEAILPEKTTYKLLFIGNSATYVNDIPATLASLCAKKGITIVQKQIVPGGRTLEEHSNDPAVYTEIAKGYDAVFLQENGTMLTNDPSREKSLAAIEKIGKAVHESGAKFCFYVRPPYGKDLGGYVNFDQCRIFDEHFTPAAEKYDAHCVYVNRAFAYAIKNCGANLWGSDNAHTNTRGAYLAVCTFYATLFGKSATELDTAYGLAESEAKTLQEAADKIAIEGVIPWEN